MIEKPRPLPEIKNVQVKLSLDEYDLLDQLAHGARKRITAYARELFVRAIVEEHERKTVKFRPVRKPS